MAALAVLVGSAEAVRPVASLDELAGLVDLVRLSRAPARFDEAELDSLNAQAPASPALSRRSRVASRRSAYQAARPFWLAVRGNLARFADAAGWWRVVTGPIEPVVGGRRLPRGGRRAAAARAVGRTTPGAPGPSA